MRKIVLVAVLCFVIALLAYSAFFALGGGRSQGRAIDSKQLADIVYDDELGNQIKFLEFSEPAKWSKMWHPFPIGKWSLHVEGYLDLDSVESFVGPNEVQIWKEWKRHSPGDSFDHIFKTGSGNTVIFSVKIDGSFEMRASTH
jgi:hypothetical protein